MLQPNGLCRRANLLCNDTARTSHTQPSSCHVAGLLTFVHVPAVIVTAGRRSTQTDATCQLRRRHSTSALYRNHPPRGVTCPLALKQAATLLGACTCTPALSWLDSSTWCQHTDAVCNTPFHSSHRARQRVNKSCAPIKTLATARHCTHGRCTIPHACRAYDIYSTAVSDLVSCMQAVNSAPGNSTPGKPQWH